MNLKFLWLFKEADGAQGRIPQGAQDAQGAHSAQGAQDSAGCAGFGRASKPYEGSPGLTRA